MTPTFMRKGEKISLPITMETFSSILHYIISVKIISRKFIHNIMTLLEYLDRTPYDSDEEKQFVIDAIGYVAKMRYDGINNLTYVKNSLMQSNLNQSMVVTLYENLKEAVSEMTKEEYDNLERTVMDYVDFIYIFFVRPEIIKLYSELMGEGERPSIDVIHNLKDVFESTLSNIRKADTTRDDTGDISIDPKNKKTLGVRTNKLYDQLNDPSNNFKTGLKELNRFLNGGYKRSKMYIYYAPTNSFKSGVLLYNAIWFMKFNPNMKPKFPNKRLGILLLTMENSVDETLDRIHAIYTGGQVDPTRISREQYNQQWDEIWDDLFKSNFSLFVEYASPGFTSVDIQALASTIEDDNNVELAAIIIDHLGNVGKLDKRADDRSGLIATAYELSDWAKRSDRLILTAMHTNSTFDGEISDAIANGKSNLVSMMGRHCIADAKYIDRAVDMSIYMYKEYSHYDGNNYLGFKYEKVRGKEQRGGSNIFYHKLENGITLRFDEGTQSCFSYPRIPGSETMAQQANTPSPIIQPSNNNVSVALPMGAPVVQHIGPQVNQNPFAGMVNNPLSAPSSISINPEIKINMPNEFNIDTMGNNNPFIGDPRELLNNGVDDDDEELNDEDFENAEEEDDDDISNYREDE